MPWGFTLSGGKDQGITVKVGCVLQVGLLNNFVFFYTDFLEDSVADSCGLKTKDYVWKVSGVEVFGKTHAECVRMIRNSGNTIQENLTFQNVN